MMHTTYSSSIISLTNCTTFNDYSYYYSNQRCPSTCCCSFLVPTNPSFLYGLRQSTLINCPTSRRFILGFNDRYCCRSSVYHVGRCCCFESSCVKQVGVDEISRKSGCVKDKRIDVKRVKSRTAKLGRDLRVYALSDAEAMLSLLSNDIVEECVVFREKKKRSPQGGKVVCKQNVVIEELRDVKEDMGFGYRESKSKKHGLRSDRVQFRDEGRRRKGEREARDEDSKFRRRESGSSSYSVSDSGEFGSDIEVELGHEQFVGDSSTSLKKDSRKSGGVVISEEAKQDWEKYRNDKDQELRISRRDDHRVGSSIQENWRKKSEKKLTEESQESKFKNESILRQSQLSQAKESSMIVSSLKNEFNYQEQQLMSDVKSYGRSSSHIQNDNRISEYSKYSGQHEGSTQKRRENIETSSTARRRLRQGEDSVIVDELVRETGCELCKTCGRSMENNKAQSDFQKKTEKSKMSVDTKLTTNAESLSEIRHKKQEKGSSSLQRSTVEEKEQHAQMHMAKQEFQHHHGIISSDDSYVQSTLREQRSEERRHSSVEKSKTSAESQSESRRTQEEKSKSSLETSVEENRHHDQIYQGTSTVDVRRESLHYSGIMDADHRFRQSNLRSQQQSETQLKHLEEITTSHITDDEVERLHEESNKVSHTQIGHSRVHSSDLEINRKSISDKSVYNEQTYSKAKLQSSEELVEKHKRLEETIVQSTVRTEVQGPSTGHFSSEAIISQQVVPLISQSGVQQLSGQDNRSEHFSVTSPKFQYQSQFSEASSSGVRNAMGSIIEVGSGSTQRHPHVRTSSFYGEDDDSGIKSGVECTPEDALASATGTQESSALNIGVFVEQMSHEASTSETSSEKKIPKLDVKHSDDKKLLKRSSQLDTDKTGLLKQGSDQLTGISSPHSEKKMSQKQDSSPDFLIKGSSDQMWDVKDHFVQEASEMESSEGAKSESVIAVRTGKSLWNIVANICRLRWGSLSENQKSPVIKQSSPTGSAGGETWFSGDEVDEAYGDGMKAEKISLLQETTSDQSLLRTTKSQKADVIMSVDNKLSLVDAGASSSSTALQSSSLSEGALVGENTNLIVPQNMSLPSPSVGLSVPSSRQLRRSPALEEVDKEEKKETLIGSSEDQKDSLHDDWRSDVSPSEGGTDISPSEGGHDVSPSGERYDADSGRRKLQRSKLVLQRFDEWEDAYRREREQRKVDEIFMREALSEAIKASDSWEVPVGAVLVQNGKIIARGYNLVEELRDSTAHAEMICIREASNALRSWRLSETTLYVTLEPCPMCAGAILQARISTLVWGAPNKLLGADGSWIRLFPEGLEGEERSEVMDKPAAPVHPFHPKMNIRRGILQEECAGIMQQFFQLKRRKAKPNTTSVEESVQPTCFPKPKHKSKLLHKMHNVFHHSNPSVD